jgi:hypothetical protein
MTIKNYVLRLFLTIVLFGADLRRRRTWTTP